jgi:hypothetical protein
MKHGQEKSDLFIRALKPTNKPGRLGACSSKKTLAARLLVQFSSLKSLAAEHFQENRSKSSVFTEGYEGRRNSASTFTALSKSQTRLTFYENWFRQS